MVTGELSAGQMRCAVTGGRRSLAPYCTTDENATWTLLSLHGVVTFAMVLASQDRSPWILTMPEFRPPGGPSRIMKSVEHDLYKDVLFAPQERQSHQPILALEQSAGARPIFWRQYAGGCRELRAGDLTAHGARCDPNMRIISHALVFSRVATGHDVELVIVFCKPYRCIDGGPVFAEAGQTDVLLALNLGRNWVSHALAILRETSPPILQRYSPREMSARRSRPFEPLHVIRCRLLQSTVVC